MSLHAWLLDRKVRAYRKSRWPATGYKRQRSLGVEELESRQLLNVTWHGGPVLQHVQVETIYYGWNGQVGGVDEAQRQDRYLGYLSGSNYLGMLSEYGVGTGSWVGRDVVPGNLADPVDDSVIQDMVKSEIQLGHVPPPNANQLYYVFTPPNLHVRFNGIISPNFLGYHSFRINDPQVGTFAYAVMPNPIGNANSLGLSVLQQLTEVGSHELAEAVTDPLGNGWFDGDTAHEVGDLCQPQLGFLHGYVVQREWSNASNPHCIVPVDSKLYAVNFRPGAYVAPAHVRPDRPLGPLGSIPTNIEPLLSVSDADPGNLAVSSQDGLSVSPNDGGTGSGAWTFPTPSDGDTGTVYDGAGRLFWMNLNLSTHGITISQRDRATGAPVAGPFAVSSPPAGSEDDKEFIAADQNNNNLYVVWTRFAADGTTSLLLSRSTNQGVTWSAPVQVSEAGEGFVWPATVSSAPNGDVYIAYHSQTGFTASCGQPCTDPGNPNGTSGKTFVARYTNDLSTRLSKTLAFGPGQSDVTANVQSAPRTIPQTQFWTQGSEQPWVLADPSQPGNVYVVAADDPSDGAGAPYSRVVFARSTNNGAAGSWTVSTLDNVSGNSFQLFPTAAIDRFGDIVVAWYDNRRGLTNIAGRFLLDVFAKYSTDGGLTWSPSFQVNDPANPFDPDPGAVNRFNGPPPTKRIGEYFGLTIFGGTAYVAWNGNGSDGLGNPIQQVWFNAFPINGTLWAYGIMGGDTITVRGMAGNAGFDEVLVNGQRVYGGLVSGIAGGIKVFDPGVADILVLDFNFGNPIPAGGMAFTGGSSGVNQIIVNADVNYILTDTSLTIGALGTVQLQQVQSATLLGGPSDNIFTLNNWSGLTTIDGDGGNNTLIVGPATVLASRVTNVQNLQIVGGTVIIDVDSTVQNLVLSAGVLTGPNALAVTNSALWNGGLMSGAGATNIGAAVTLTINGNNDKFLSLRTVNNAGTTLWQDAGNIWADAGALFNNQLGALFDAQNDQRFAFNVLLPLPAFNNAGTFRKSAGLGSTSMEIPFFNSGLVQAQSGTFTLAGGGSGNGTFTINAGALVQFPSGVYRLDNGATLNGAGFARVNGGVVTIGLVAADAVTAQNISLVSGTINGPGTITVNGIFNWTGGTMSGTGTTTIAAAAALNIFGDFVTKFLDRRTVNNLGTTTWTGTGDDITFTNQATFINQAGATFDAQNNQSLVQGVGLLATFANAGTFKKSAGINTTTVGIAFINTNLLQVQTGIVRLARGGNSNGIFTIAAGSLVDIPGNTYTFNNGATINGAGFAQVSGTGTATIGAAAGDAVTAQNFALVSGTATLNGPGNLTVNGVFNWNGGTMSGAGTTTIAAAAALNINGTAINPNLKLDTRTLTNAGTATWTGLGDDITLANAAIFNNQAGATFDAQNDQSLVQGVGANATFSNAGTFKKSGGINTTAVAITFNNANQVQALNSTLSFSGGGTSTGGNFNAAAGALLDFNGGVYNVNAPTSITGAGVVRFSGGTVNLAGAYNVAGTTTIVGGTANFVANGTSATTNLVAGVLTGAGIFTTTTFFAWTGGTMSGTGVTAIAAGALLSINANLNLLLDTRTVNNAGATIWTGVGDDVIFANGAIFNNQAGATFDAQNNQSLLQGVGGAAGFNNIGTLQKSAGNGVTTFGLNMPFNTTGTVLVQNGTLNFTGAYIQQNPGVTVVNAGTTLAAAGGVNIQGGALSGYGTVNANVTNNGQVYPGGILAAGLLTIQGDYTQTPAGVLNIDIGGYGAGFGYDQLSITGTANLAGTLNVNLINGFMPVVNDAFQVLVAGQRVGMFGFYNGLQFGALRFDPRYDAFSLTLVVVANCGPGLSNGGFETGDFTCWTLSGLMQFSSVTRDNPHTGNFAAHLGEVGGFGFLSQTVATTAGRQYRLTYWLAHNFFAAGTPNRFQVSIAGNIVYDQTDLPVFPYTSFTFNFVAAGPTTIQFGDREDPSYFDLDDVSLDALGDLPSAPSSMSPSGPTSRATAQSKTNLTAVAFFNSSSGGSLSGPPTLSLMSVQSPEAPTSDIRDLTHLRPSGSTASLPTFNRSAHASAVYDAVFVSDLFDGLPSGERQSDSPFLLPWPCFAPPRRLS